MKRPVQAVSAAASIDEKIKNLGDWRGEMLARVRQELGSSDRGRGSR